MQIVAIENYMPNNIAKKNGDFDIQTTKYDCFYVYLETSL